MKLMNRLKRTEKRRVHLMAIKAYHKRVHPVGIRIMPSAQGEWMRGREDIKCCRFCGRWYLLPVKKERKGYGNWLTNYDF